MENSNLSKKVSVIIVTYNSERVIEKCLSSVPSGVEVFVVDNASADNTRTIISDKFPDVKLIKNKVNNGFGAANNIALNRASTDFALLLNPDTVLEENSIQTLLEKMDKYKDAAIISPLLYLEGRAVQKSYKTSIFKREDSKATYYLPDGDICADCLSGAVMLLRMEYVKEFNFFDENFFLFYEDDDFCLQARGKGYSLIYTPDSRVKHLMGESSPQTKKIISFKNKHMAWSRLYIEEKYKGKKSAKNLAFSSLYYHLIKALLYCSVFKGAKAYKHFGKMVGSFKYIINKKP